MKKALYILCHPIDGFWELKRTQSGNWWAGAVLLLLTVVASIFNRQMRAFVFNTQYNVPLNIVKEVCVILLPVVLFCLSNWAITTLMDGKGNMKDIFLTTCYSLIPLILFFTVTPLISQLLSLNELTYLKLLDIGGYCWTGLMLFLGIQQIHEYSFGKMIGTTVLTAISAAIIVFIALLFFSLLQELGGFAYSIYREISLRM